MIKRQELGQKSKNCEVLGSGQYSKSNCGRNKLEKEPSPIACMKATVDRPKAYDAFMLAMSRRCC